MNKLPIEEYFRYHPPTTQQRRDRHDAVNQTALEFAKVIDAVVADEDCKKMALFAVQQARMFANQGVVVDELELATNAPMPPRPADSGWMSRLMGDPAGAIEVTGPREDVDTDSSIG